MWEDSLCVALKEEVCHWGLTLKIQKLMAFPMSFSSPGAYGTRCKRSAIAPFPACCHFSAVMAMNSNPLELRATSHGALSQQLKTKTIW